MISPIHEIKLENWSSSDPAVRALMAETKRRDMSITGMASLAGIHHRTPYAWRRKDPGISNLRAALNAVGLDLAVVPLQREAAE